MKEREKQDVHRSPPEDFLAVWRFGGSEIGSDLPILPAEVMELPPEDTLYARRLSSWYWG